MQRTIEVYDFFTPKISLILQKESSMVIKQRKKGDQSALRLLWTSSESPNLWSAILAQRHRTPAPQRLSAPGNGDHTLQTESMQEKRKEHERTCLIITTIIVTCTIYSKIENYLIKQPVLLLSMTL